MADVGIIERPAVFANVCAFLDCSFAVACNNEAMQYRLRFPVAAFVATVLVLFAPLASYAVTTYRIGMGPNYFTYPTITIYTGDTVIWTNTDSNPHTISSGNSQFDSGTMQPGATYSKTFTVPGTYHYQSVLDAGMTGVVIVQDAQALNQQQMTQPQVTVSQTTNPAVTGDLQTQLNGLLQELAALQQQIGSTHSTSASTNGAATCLQLGRSLRLGMSGSDVSALQQFLARDPSIYPEGRITGYFGALTQAAVQRFQAAHNIVSSGTPSTTGYGTVGPRTIAAIALACNSSSAGAGSGVVTPVSQNDVGGVLQATPLSGAAPLRVTFQITVNTLNSCAATIYNLDFGDGSSQPIPSVAGVCQPQSVAISHVYQNGGAFKVVLSTGSHSTFTTVSVSGATLPNTQPLAQVVVHMANIAYAPANLSVSPGTTVVWTNDDSVQHTVTFNSGLIDSGPINPGQSFSTLFTQSGTFPYYCKLHGAPGSGMNGAITVSTTAAPVNAATTAPTPVGYGPLTVTLGTAMQVTATFDTKGSCDAYELDWGDDSTNNTRFQSSTNCTTSENVSLTHTYSAAGTYTVTLGRGPAFQDEVTASAVVH
jgi:plastocyanin/peptidoglycan hydrolase-like protein with peptidoglycan-binding domain